MNKTLLKPWIEALESGEYKQGVGLLECDGHFCCLGVLCVVAEKQGMRVKRREGELSGINLSCDQPFIKNAIDLNVGDEGNLMHMNDHGKSFTEIAAYLRENYLNV